MHVILNGKNNEILIKTRQGNAAFLLAILKTRCHHQRAVSACQIPLAFQCLRAIHVLLICFFLLL